MNQRTLEEIAGLAHTAQQREIEKLTRSVEALRQKVRELVKNAAKEEAASPSRPVFEDRNVAASQARSTFEDRKVAEVNHTTTEALLDVWAKKLTRKLGQDVAASRESPSFGEAKPLVDLVAIRNQDCDFILAESSVLNSHHVQVALRRTWNMGFDRARRLYEKLRQMERKYGWPSGG